MVETTTHVRGDEACVGCGYSLRGAVVEGVCPECGVAVRRTLESVSRGGFTVAAMRAARRAQVLMICGLLALPLSRFLGLVGPSAGVLCGAAGALVVVGIAGYQLGGIGSIAEPVPRQWRRWAMVATAAGAAVAAVARIMVVEWWTVAAGFGLLLANTWAVLIQLAWMREQENWQAKQSNGQILSVGFVLALLAYTALGFFGVLAAVVVLAESYRYMGRLIRKRAGKVEGGGAG